jgi:hypothetical protein
MEILHRYRMSQDAGSVSLLSWSPWTIQSVDGKKVAAAFMAVSDAEGRVWVLEISQIIDSPHPAFAHCADEVIRDENTEDVWASDPVLFCDPDAVPATQMTWVPSVGGGSRLVSSEHGDALGVHLTVPRASLA